MMGRAALMPALALSILLGCRAEHEPVVEKGTTKKSTETEKKDAAAALRDVAIHVPEMHGRLDFT